MFSHKRISPHTEYSSLDLALTLSVASSSFIWRESGYPVTTVVHCGPIAALICSERVQIWFNRRSSFNCRESCPWLLEHILPKLLIDAQSSSWSLQRNVGCLIPFWSQTQTLLQATRKLLTLLIVHARISVWGQLLYGRAFFSNIKSCLWDIITSSELILFQRAKRHRRADTTRGSKKRTAEIEESQDVDPVRYSLFPRPLT